MRKHVVRKVPMDGRVLSSWISMCGFCGYTFRASTKDGYGWSVVTYALELHVKFAMCDDREPLTARLLPATF